MKKALLGTSAIALVSAISTTATAAEWEVKVGGYMEQYLAYADPSVDGFAGDDFNGVDNKADSEIAFKPSITLDNGLKIGVDIQLEGAGFTGTPDTIDESFLFISGSFGRVNIGSENSAGYLMSYGAPDVTFLGANSGSLNNFIPFSGNVGTNNGQAGIPAGGLNVGDDVFRGTLGSTFLENNRNNDAQRFTYFTPRFAGFQLGASYARDGNQDTNGQLNLNGASLKNIIDVGANYVNSFGGFDVAVSGRYGIAGTDVPGASNPQVYGGGVNLGFAGVTIGGSFAEQNNTASDDGRSFDAGISYETGPWGFSFTYFNGENHNDENAFDVLGNDENLQQFLLGASYKLAKGVSLNAFGAYVDFDEERGDAGGPNVAGGDDVDGFVIGTGIKVSF